MHVPDLPTGTVTFLFTDIEGSTALLQRLGPRYADVLERHHALLRAAIKGSGGVEVSTEGDAFFVVFPSALAAVGAAAAAQRALAEERWPSKLPVRVRMGLHTGEGTLGGDNYVGLDVHRAARIAASAHGGEVILSAAARAIVEGSLPAGLRLRELGQFRLKDLARPEQLVQLVIRGLREDFPAPRSLEVPADLPAQVTSFVGRERELAEVGALLDRSRLVTLTGPGGTGKTRLGLRVAEEARPKHADGAFFVGLAPVSDPQLIPTTIAQAVGVDEEASRPVLDSLEAYLRDRHMLLFLDNLEQLMAGAPLVSRLIGSADHLTILATSREPLHLRGEQEYPVPPLGAPDLAARLSIEALAAYDAVILFVQRARAVRPDFTLDDANAAAVAAICTRLNGLPLAIELAAARIKLFAPAAIQSRLEKSLALLTGGASDLPERQRTLRGAIEWSYDLLHPFEQTIFHRLAVFRGGSTLESAEAVCDPEHELGADVLDTLASLMDKSLLQSAPTEDGEPRFGMLETIREFGLERLAGDPDVERVRQRYEEHFAGLAREAEPALLGGEQKAWLDRLDRERDNLRAAAQLAAEDGRIELALRMSASLWRFWQQRGHLAEGREALARLLARPDASTPTKARAQALAGLGGVTYWQADVAAAGRAYAEALEIERALSDPIGLAEALYNSAYVATVVGEYETAQADYEEAMRLYQQAGDRAGLTRLREGLVFLLFHRGDFASARELQEENLAAFRAGGEPFRIANGITILSAIRLKEGDFAGTRDGLVEALQIFRQSGDLHAIVRILMLAATLSLAEGDPVRAARTTGAADAIREPLGEIATPLQLLRIEDPAPIARAALGEEAFEAAYKAGRSMALDEIVADVAEPPERPAKEGGRSATGASSGAS